MVLPVWEGFFFAGARPRDVNLLIGLVTMSVFASLWAVTALNVLCDHDIDHDAKVDAASWRGQASHRARFIWGSAVGGGIASAVMLGGRPLCSASLLGLQFLGTAYSSLTPWRAPRAEHWGLKRSVVGHFTAFVLGYLAIRLSGAAAAGGFLSWPLWILLSMSSLSDHALVALESTFDGKQERRAGMTSLGARWSTRAALGYCIAAQILSALVGVSVSDTFGLLLVVAAAVRCTAAIRATTVINLECQPFSVAESWVDAGFILSRGALALGALAVRATF